MQHYGLSEGDVEDRLLVDSGRQQPIAIARQMREKATLPGLKTADNLTDAARQVCAAV